MEMLGDSEQQDLGAQGLRETGSVFDSPSRQGRAVSRNQNVPVHAGLPR